MKVGKTSKGEQVLALTPGEILESSTVSEAFRLIGCSKRSAKERTEHFFFALTTLLAERANELGDKEKGSLYDRELRREEREHRRVLEEMHRMMS